MSSLPQINKTISGNFLRRQWDRNSSVTNDGEHLIREGNGVYEPTRVEHAFVNSGDIPLELIIVVDLVPEGTEVESDTAIISNYRERQPAPRVIGNR